MFLNIEQLMRFSIAILACALNLVVLSSIVFVLYFVKYVTGCLSRTWSSMLSSVIEGLIYRHSMHLRMILQTICGVSFQVLV